MPDASADPYIQQWFAELNKFKAACISTGVGPLTLLQFANATITDYLKSDNSQKNFITSVAASTGYDLLSTADLTTYKTFRGLLDHCHLLENDIYNVLQAASDPTVQKLGSVAYYATPAATAFPGTSTGALWQPARATLMASMDQTCFTLPFRLKVDATLDRAATGSGAAAKPAATMSEVIKQIVGLG